jgi:hypothetical protein
MIFEWGNEAVKERSSLRADAAKPREISQVARCRSPSFPNLATRIRGAAEDNLEGEPHGEQLATS